MNFIKRAWYSLKVKVGRSILLIAVFSAILIFILAGLTIKSAALQASENAKESIGATATLSLNRENIKEQRDQKDTSTTDSATSRVIKLSDAENIANLDKVSTYNILSSSSAGETTKFTPVAETTTDSTTAADSNMPDDAKGPMAQAQGDFAISGVLSSADATDFGDDGSTLTSGEAITSADKDTNNVLIEETLAEQNELTVGDTFKISNPTDDSKTYTMTVKGIYETSEVADSMGMSFNFMNPVNTIYASYTFANTLKGSAYKNTADSATYNLTAPKEMDAFAKKAEKLIDTETYAIQTNDEMYQQMLEPISNITSFSENIVLLVSIAGTIILALIVMLTIRERRYEIGVLLALGESRTKVICQFLVELIIVLLISLIIAGFSGNLVGNVVGNQLLEQQNEASTTTTTQTQTDGPGGSAPSGAPGGNGGGGAPDKMGGTNTTKTEQIKELDITLSVKQLVELGGLGLGICFLSVCIASVGIIRLKPKNILTS